MSPMWTPSAERVAQTPIARFMSEVGKARLRGAAPLVGRACARVLEPALGLLRRDRREGRPRRLSTATTCRARAFSRRRASTSRRTCCAASRRRRGDRVLGRGHGQASHDLQAAARRWSRAWRRRSPTSASARAIASPAICPTCRRRSPPCSPPRASALSGRRCSPDFGVQGVIDRFGQIEPKVLFCADGYIYNGKEFDRQSKVSRDGRPAAERRGVRRDPTTSARPTTHRHAR